MDSQVMEGFATPVEVVSDEWVLKLMEGGLLFEIHIGRWQGKTRLKPEDLGISLPVDPEERQIAEEFQRLGDQYLLPAATIRRLASIESSARQNLTSCSVPIKVLSGNFVPARSLTRFKERHEELRSEYFAVRDSIVANLEAIKAQMAEKFQRLAEVALRREYGEGAADSPEAYVDDYVRRVLAAIPSADYIRQSFTFEARPMIVPFPSLLATSTGGDVREALLQQAMEDEAKRYWLEKKREVVDGFLSDLVLEVRGRVYDTVAASLETLRRNDGELPGRTTTGLKNLIEAVRELDIYGDTDIEAGLKALESQLERKSTDRDMGEMIRTLQDLDTLTRASLVALGGGRGRKVAEMEMPNDFEVMVARERLGLDDVEPAAVATAVQRVGRREL